MFGSNLSPFPRSPAATDTNIVITQAFMSSVLERLAMVEADNVDLRTTVQAQGDRVAEGKVILWEATPLAAKFRCITTL